MFKFVKKIFSLFKEPPHPKEETCANCKYLFSWSDGSSGCWSPYEKYCLKGPGRKWKEVEDD